jgi:processive 1,2-diacylglycerol beta-glucosyltransferase
LAFLIDILSFLLQSEKMNKSKNNLPETKLFFLILSCSGGAGHLRAAEALHRTAQLMKLPIKTEHYDILDFTPKYFKRLYSGSYLQMVNRAPELWGYLYQQSERKPYKKNGLIRSFDHMMYRNYLDKISQLKPDAIICTHFLPYISISNELRAKNLDIPFFAATTDFDVHQLWIDPIIKKYFVFHNESAWQLNSKNVPATQIKVTGIPIMPDFLRGNKKGSSRKILGIKPDVFTILVLSGGFGIGHVKDIVCQVSRSLADHRDKRFNLLIVCGKNETIQKEIQSMCFSKNITPHIHGFVNNIHQLMDSADLVITKSGGLTSSEALSKSLPMLIIDPIPGQESRNADLIVEHGAGWKAINLANLSYKLHHIITNPAILGKARIAAGKLAEPEAASKILTDVYKYIQSSKANAK